LLPAPPPQVLTNTDIKKKVASAHPLRGTGLAAEVRLLLGKGSLPVLTHMLDHCQNSEIVFLLGCFLPNVSTICPFKCHFRQASFLGAVLLGAQQWSASGVALRFTFSFLRRATVVPLEFSGDPQHDPEACLHQK